MDQLSRTYLAAKSGGKFGEMARIRREIRKLSRQRRRLQGAER